MVSDFPSSWTVRKMRRQVARDLDKQKIAMLSSTVERLSEELARWNRWYYGDDEQESLDLDDFIFARMEQCYHDSTEAGVLQTPLSSCASCFFPTQKKVLPAAPRVVAPPGLDITLSKPTVPVLQVANTEVAAENNNDGFATLTVAEDAGDTKVAETPKGDVKKDLSKAVGNVSEDFKAVGLAFIDKIRGEVEAAANAHGLPMQKVNEMWSGIMGSRAPRDWVDLRHMGGEVVAAIERVAVEDRTAATAAELIAEENAVECDVQEIPSKMKEKKPKKTKKNHATSSHDLWYKDGKRKPHT